MHIAYGGVTEGHTVLLGSRGADLGGVDGDSLGNHTTPALLEGLFHDGVVGPRGPTADNKGVG